MSEKIQLPDRNQLLVLLCASVPSFMINLDSNIVAVSLPSIARSLNTSYSAIEWVISAYTLAFASLVLPAGALADRYGRKHLLIIGLFIFTVASGLCGAAVNPAMLNLSRAMQGMGAALQLSSALAILSHSFRGAERARAFAFWGAVIGVAITLGPIAGGIITQGFGWQWAFYINIPVGMVMIALTFYAVPHSQSSGTARIDAAGCVSFGTALFLVTLALISGNRDGWLAQSIILELTGACAAFAVFLAVEIRQEHPMLDLRFFRARTYVGANVSLLAFASCLITMLTYLPIYFQSGLNYDPRTAGLLMLPMAVPLFLVPRLLAARLSDHLSGRALLTIGLALVSGGLCWMAYEAPFLRYPGMLGGMLIAGTGAGLLNGETAKVGMTALPPDRAGMASGTFGTIRYSGIVIGFAALGAILFHAISAKVSASLPAWDSGDRLVLIHQIATGDTSGGGMGGPQGVALRALAIASYGDAFQALLLAAGAFAGLSALLTWLLVRSSDTAPLTRQNAAKRPAITVTQGID